QCSATLSSTRRSLPTTIIYPLSLHDALPICGPSHAEEVAMRQPTTVTVSSENNQNLAFSQDLFMNQSFRVYTSRDLLGTELGGRSEEHTSELQSRFDLVCRLLLEKKNKDGVS